MPKSIPPRQPIGDLFTGCIVGSGDRRALALAPCDGLTTIAAGTFVIRYGVPFLGKPHLSIVPALIALEYGDFLTGDDAWDFVLKRSNLYPRAEVFGYRHDGRDDMMYVKTLDLAAPIAVLVYADDQATTPIASVSAVLADEAAASALPARLVQYVPRFDTGTAWLAEAVSS